MNISRDPLLESLIKIAEVAAPADPPEVFRVTLAIGGLLVTGRIISHDEFMRHHPCVEKLWEKYPRPQSEVPPHQRVTGEGERWCIHLADARIAPAGQAATPPAGPGIYWRGRLSEVAGFSFAKTTVPDAAPKPGRAPAK